MRMNPAPPPHSAAKVTATVRLSRYNSCEEVGWRRVVIIKHCRLSVSFFLSAVLDCPAGSTWCSGGGGRTISCWKQPSSCSPHHAYFILFIWEDGGLARSCNQQSLLNLPSILQLLSQLFGIFNRLGHARPESPCKAELWVCMRSCGLPLLCRYLVWTSSSRSQLGKGWPIL